MTRFKHLLITILCLALTKGLIAEQISVSMFSPKAIESTVEKIVSNQLIDIPDLEVISEVKNPEIFNNIPKEAVYVSIDFSKPESYLGKILLDISFLDQDNHFLSKKKCLLKTEAFGSIFVAVHKIKSNHIINDTDIQKKKVQLNSRPELYIYNKQYIIGKQAKQSMMKGAAFTDNWIELVPMIRRGDHISALIKSPGYEIKCEAIALDAGMKGETVRLKTELSKKIIRGEILNDQTILVRTN